MISVGQKVLFNPLFCLSNDEHTNDLDRSTFVIGIIIKVYEDHGWCLVEYTRKNKPIHMGFRLTDIGGPDVRLIDENITINDIIPRYRRKRLEFKKVTE